MKIKSPAEAPEKKRLGAPSKWRPEFNEAIIRFFDRKPYTDTTIELEQKEGKPGKVIKNRDVVDMPFFSDFAASIGACTSMVVTWAKEENEEKYPGFRSAYLRAKELQEQILVTNTLRGNYEQQFAIFTAKNIFNWRDKSDVRTTGTLTYAEALKKGIKSNEDSDDE